MTARPESRLNDAANGNGPDQFEASRGRCVLCAGFELSETHLPSPLTDQVHNSGMSDASTIFELAFTSNQGDSVPLATFSGRPLLIVNTASRCGFTPQYEGLQELHERYRDDGLVVIGFPCDQFAHQEPGDDAEIEEFCTSTYGVNFLLSTKVDVNGRRTHPVFAFLKHHAGGILGSAIKWNFTKFLVAPDGMTIRRYAPTTEPSAISSDIEALFQVD